MNESEHYMGEDNQHFIIHQRPSNENLTSNQKEFSEAVIEMARKKGLTYTEAYTSLDYAYQFMQFDSQFLPMK